MKITKNLTQNYQRQDENLNKNSPLKRTETTANYQTTIKKGSLTSTLALF